MKTVPAIAPSDDGIERHVPGDPDDDHRHEARVGQARERAALEEREIERVRLALEPDVIDKLFQAFYTTKSGGMGIGLSVSRSIIEKHGGRLWGEANDGPGATFAFSIPQDPERTTDAARVMRNS